MGDPAVIWTRSQAQSHTSRLLRQNTSACPLLPLGRRGKADNAAANRRASEEALPDSKDILPSPIQRRSNPSPDALCTSSTPSPPPRQPPAQGATAGHRPRRDLEPGRRLAQVRPAEAVLVGPAPARVVDAVVQEGRGAPRPARGIVAAGFARLACYPRLLRRFLLSVMR
ncbi:hypothetical protein CDD83_4014 [Cordyceps sp. RAO-2017]|nr:hypothetical protein CDD83_4014 [Cordyceps sp. RAO-2017]